MRVHTKDEAVGVVELVESWQKRFRRALGRPVIQLADEYYLLSERPFPNAASYDGYPQYESGIGIARSFAEDFRTGTNSTHIDGGGFFASVDGAPAFGYRAPRADRSQTKSVEPNKRVVILTGQYGAQALQPVLSEHGYGDVEIIGVGNEFFGGNIAVTGLIAGIDVARALEKIPTARRVLLPDVCLSNGRFIDGMDIAELGRPIEVLETNGATLRHVLDGSPSKFRSDAPLAISGRR